MSKANTQPKQLTTEEMIVENVWHDRAEIDTFVAKIKELSVDRWGDGVQSDDTNAWSWAYNWKCKYVNLRFDMRDGGFILTNDDGERISLKQLEYQRGAE